MKVWIVEDGDYDCSWVVGVFTTREEAEKCQKHGSHYTPTEHEVREVFVPDAVPKAT